MRDALASFRIDGISTTIPFHQAVLAHPDFVQNRITTRWVENNLIPELYRAESVT